MLAKNLFLSLLAVSPGMTQYKPPRPAASSEPQRVFAHFIVGNAYSMTPQHWETDIIEASKAHIDGFALNVAPQDDYTDRVLQTAYDAAERIGNFSLFISFDYGSGGPWPADRVINTINAYKGRRAQFHYHGKPLVSTFEGVANAGDWPRIKSATGCIFIPNWTSMGPEGIRGVLNEIDGAFSWDAWPVGAEDKNASSDLAWMNALAGKPYMMPVAPWFYTNLPQWNKNWLWRGDDMWHYRWQQVMELQPALVQILSWNDYGETHYIGPIYEPGIPDGAARYVQNHPHDAWRELLPYYIDSYRRNLMNPHSQLRAASPGFYNPKYPMSFTDKIVYWYRLNPSTAGSSEGTTGNNPAAGQRVLPPGQISQDRVFFSTFITQPSDVYAQIGGESPTFFRVKSPGINHFSVPFYGQRGPVRFGIMRNHQEVATATGPPISDQCIGGVVDWNAFVGSSG
ncbi:mutanase [Aspergillus steynii IBT 23096]|uniref:Mutanase n=1 Tax=Aspergillus steynii IBT 23096 TaxID=1392250 RepID=A0A2I2FR99_9EURO|nr:mutanase [Aspergillus steynii IBT 23096]PLB43141.1 mutanase [Aspergillus steynii IBT 23096]